VEYQKVYIVVLNYNTWLDTIECLQSLLQQQFSSYEIIVVDNCSNNDSRFQLLEWGKENIKKIGGQQNFDFTVSEYKNNSFISLKRAENAILHLVWSDKNGGYAYGNNIGILYSRYHSSMHFIWILNNDTVVMPDTLSKLRSCFNTTGWNVGLVGCIQTYYNQPQRVQCLYGVFNSTWGITKEQGVGIDIKDSNQYRGRPIDYLYGACLFTHTSVLDQVGLLSEDYFLYFEELDFATRLKKEGLLLVCCFEANILHKQGGSTGTDGKPMTFITPFSDFNTFRSKFIFARKFYKNYILLYLFVSCLQILHRVVKGKFKNATAVIKGIFHGLSNKY
jgi:GT2 family glycosyltransferase